MTRRATSLLILAPIAASVAAQAAPPKSAPYAGQVRRVTGGTAEILRGARFVPLPVGTSLADGDCVRVTALNANMTIEMDDDSQRTVGYRAQGCDVVRSRAAPDRITPLDYVFSLVAWLKRGGTARSDASSRGPNVKLAALGAPRPPAAILAGSRRLYVSWCSSEDMLVSLQGPRNERPSIVARNRKSARLPLTAFAPGDEWTLAVKQLDGRRSWTARLEVVATIPGASPSTTGPRLVGRLSTAAALMRADPEGRYDFEAMQTLTGEDDAETGDVFATYFCPEA